MVIVILEGTFYEGNLRLSRDLGAAVEAAAAAAAAAAAEEWERKALTGISPVIITSNIIVIIGSNVFVTIIINIIVIMIVHIAVMLNIISSYCD